MENAVGGQLALDEADALLAALESGSTPSLLPLLPDPPSDPLSASSEPSSASDAVSKDGVKASSTAITVSKRERERRELLFLRTHSKQLATQLEALRSSIASGRQLSARQSIWRHIARRRLSDRRHAERENSRLRVELSQHLRFARELQVKAANSVDGERTNSSTDSKARRPPYMLEDRDRMVLEQLVSELDLAYGLIDTMLPERERSSAADAVGSVGSTYYSIRKTQLLESVSGSPTSSPSTGAELAWVELRDARVIPFDFRLVIDAVWRSWVVWHLGSSNLDTGAWSSSRRYHGVDRPEHTLALKFRLRSIKPNQSPTYLHEKVTVRRYLERDRLVLVWRCTSEGEQEFAGLSTDETEWVIVERAGLRGPNVGSSSGPEYAVIRSCVRLIPTRVGAKATARDSRAFTNLVIKSYEDDANFALREMESMLLRATTKP